ncbi:MAG: DUF4199 domain-containing protein [Asticcacaulis sp.]
MFKSILVYGVISGLVAGIVLSISTIVGTGGHGSYAMAFGYLTMLVALSAIFIAVKRHRDVDLGGVIKFWPALGMGLGISVVAGILYVAIWDISCAIAHLDFAGEYAKAMLAQQQARGASAADLAKLSAQMDAFKAQYANPLYRWPMTFIEIFPVGVLVSLISAALLRNRRFLPARA